MSRTHADQDGGKAGGQVRAVHLPARGCNFGTSPDRDRLDRSFAEQEHPRLTRLYALTAVVWCFFMLWPTTYVEFAGIPLAVAFIAHTARAPRFFLGAVLQPVFALFALYWAWGALSLLWSDDLKTGTAQIGCARWLWLIPALWPAMNRRRWLIGAMICGALAGNLSQVLHAAGVWLDIEALTWPRRAGRNSGWWDPVVGGTLLVAVLGLHLPGAAFCAGRRRWMGIVGVAVTLVAIAATGTRGAWIAGAALVGAGAVAGVWSSRSRWRALALCTVVLGAFAGAAWLAAGDSIARRFNAGREEVAAYFREGNDASDTGARLRMARRAFEAVREHPLRGVGAGGFRAWFAQDAPDSALRGHAHAHNALLHGAATTGIPGALMLGGAVAFALFFARRAAHPGSANPYDAGPFWALAGLVLVSPFDSVQVNAQTAAMLTTLMALSPPALPRAMPLFRETVEGGR